MQNLSAPPNYIPVNLHHGSVRPSFRPSTPTESDFYNPDGENTILSKEIARIKALREKGELDHYMLFSNRRLGGISETEIRAYLAKECGIPEESIYLCGTQQLELWLKQPEFSHIPASANLDPVDSPLIVSPDDLAEVVQALALHKDVVSLVLDDPPTARVAYEEKNIINVMTVEYANFLIRNYLKQTPEIRTFLAAPENSKILSIYESVVDEFQLKIIAKRKDYQSFDTIMEYLVDLLFKRDAILRQHKRLSRAIIFYMYWNCDIGEVAHATAN